jgi:hypothetical protein
LCFSREIIERVRERERKVCEIVSLFRAFFEIPLEKQKILTGPAATGPLQAQRGVRRQQDPLAVLFGQSRGLGHIIKLLGPADELERERRGERKTGTEKEEERRKGERRRKSATAVQTRKTILTPSNQNSP